MKKGISAVVATVLIILITIAAVTIIWSVVLPLVKDNLSSMSFDTDLSIVEGEGFTVYDRVANKTCVQVKRGADEAEIKAVQFSFQSGGNSYSTIVEGAPEPNHMSTYCFNSSKLDSVDSISVAPVFLSGQREKIGSITSKLDNVPEGDLSGFSNTYYNISGDRQVCVPNCAGKVCGSDGCGGDCGPCSSDKECNSTGQCVIKTCTPDCGGKVCGASDNCGGKCIVQTCLTGQTCNASGVCAQVFSMPSDYVDFWRFENFVQGNIIIGEHYNGTIYSTDDPAKSRLAEGCVGNSYCINYTYLPEYYDPGYTAFSIYESFDEYSVSFWVNPESFSNQKEHLHLFYMSLGISIELIGDTVGVRGGRYWNDPSPLTANIDENEWTHIGFTLSEPDGYDRRAGKLYINGAQVGDQEYFYDISSASVVIYFNCPSEGFSGLIDEAVVYNRGLSASEMNALYRFDYSALN